MRFETAVPLGKGATGEVFEAWDSRLQRQVAVKLLRRDDPESIERMLREAQAQARVDHPNVCRIFDVGETEGRPYISMQLVGGAPLDEAVRDLPLERRVAVLRTVADAVQAAHEVGLIHRDLKPANILVESREDGELVPVVLDFGIAREASSEGLTATGQLIGTPAYMSPEQVRGEIRTLDRRSDVFGLGVLLYEILSGRHPFVAESTVRTLVQVTDEDPPPLRSVAPRVPADLAAVVEKCLEKDPERRYPSARALVADLDRYLAGEPVRARATSLVYRLYRRARRNPVASGALAAGVAIMLILGGVAAHAHLSATERARAAQLFGQEMERIEGMLERAYLVPLHDVRPTLAQVRERLGDIEAGLGRLDPASAALGEAALGRGYLGLGDPDRARRHLERSWAAGNREPDVSWALSLALGRLYRRGLEELGAIATPEVRQRRREELERDLRDPALHYLEQAGQEGDPSHLAASLAYFAGDLEGALGHLEAGGERLPWFYEADLLAADIHRELHRRALDSGDTDAAAESFARAAEAFERAAAIGESDPRNHDGLCGLWVQALQSSFWGLVGDIRTAQEEAREACGRALAADSELPSAHLRLATVARITADREIDSGSSGDPGPALQEAREHLRQALAGRPEDPHAYVLLGVTHRIQANWEARQGTDPTGSLKRAVATYERAAALDPSFYNVHLSRALTELYLGDHLRRRGGEAVPHFERAIEASRRATALEPNLTGGYVNLGIAYGQLALVQRERGAESLPLFAAGIEALERSVAINPEFITAHFNLSELLIGQGEVLLEEGEDPATSVERALELLAQVEGQGLAYAPTKFVQLKGETLLARRALEEGQDPSAALARALGHAEQGFAIDAADATGVVLAGQAHLAAARWQLARGAGAAGPIQRARELAGRALEIDARLPAAFRLQAEAALVEAEGKAARGLDPRTALEAGTAAVARALAANPLDSRTHLVDAELRHLWGRWTAARGEEAAGHLQAALEAAGRGVGARAASLRATIPGLLAQQRR